jgi:energy-coupling factor transporter ATP-binding protein EcfA2
MFNTNKIGRPICKIVGGNDNGEVLYLDTEANMHNAGKLKKNYYSKLHIEDGTLQQVPDTTSERQCIMISGASGSGKSTYSNTYIKQYKNAYKKNPIYFFSVLDEDTSIDKKIVKRVNIDDSWINEPLTIEDVSNSLCVFDDIEMVKDKNIKQSLFDFINSILTTGRHTNTSIILTVHYPNNKYIRNFLNECHCFVYFPFGSGRATNYVLENYIGINKKDIQHIKKLNSRWCCVFKNYPQCILTEHNLFSISDLNN